jgi:hypothetical protein
LPHLARRHRSASLLPGSIAHGTRGADGALARMTDLLVIAVTVALFAATVGFVRLCERM